MKRCSFILLFLLLGQLVAELQEVCAAHFVCREHGDLCDLPSVARRSAANEPQDDTPHIAEAPLSSEPHQHCPLTLAGRNGCFSKARSPLARPAPLATGCATCPPRSMRQRTFALYLLAPSHSPPR